MSKKKKFNIWKTLLYLVLIGLFGWLIFQNITDYRVLLDTIQDANYVLLGYTVLIGVGNLATYSFIYQRSIALVSRRNHYPEFLHKTFEFIFINLSTPLGVTGASAYLTRYLVKKGLSNIQAVFGMLVANLSNNVSFLFILGFTVLSLSNSNHLEPYQTLAAEFLLLLNLGLFLITFLVIVLPSFSGKAAHFIVNIINSLTRKLIRKELLAGKSLDDYILETITISKRFDRSFGKFIKTIPLSLTYHLINISVLFLSFLAFGASIEIWKVVSLYGIIFLFAIVSPTPFGIGIVEGLAHTVAISLGIDSSVSLVAILTYRVATLWLPAFAGLWNLRRSNR